MMGTTRKRRKISSAAALREEDGAGQKDPESDRSRRSPAAGWEALAVRLAEPAPVVRAVAPVTVAVQLPARRPVDWELEALPGTPAVPRTAPAQPRLVEGPVAESAPVGRLPQRGPQAVPQAPVARRGRQKARLGPPVAEKLVAGSLPSPARRASRAQVVERQSGKQRVERLAFGREGLGRRAAGNPPPGVGPAPGRAEVAGDARRLGQGVAPGGRFFSPVRSARGAVALK